MPHIQSALDPAGPYAARIEHLWWIYFWVCTIAYVLVLIALFIAVFRKRRGSGELAGERQSLRWVSGASAVVAVVLFGLLIASIAVGRELMNKPEPAVTIELTGRQWWWQADYDHEDKSKRFSTANEITIPVGQPVRIDLKSGDVIHSFWVPSLHGKQDLTPGHDGGIHLVADRPGTWRGQCAEFCGLQHAKMAFWVNALPKDDYEKWAEAQRQPSKIPSTAQQRKGLETFLNAQCPLCHSIAGTDASGKTGPDLTHFASRRSIAAGAVPNRRGYLAGWILDPQHIKPGSQMPPQLMKGNELEPLLDYLESLQ